MREVDFYPTKTARSFSNVGVYPALPVDSHMTKETKGRPIPYQTIAMLAVIVVLAGGFTFSYASMSSQISTVCNQNRLFATTILSLITKSASTLQSNIQSDNSLIQTLNSTRPAGYADTIATLQSQVTQDTALIAYYSSLVANQTTTMPAPNPCS